MITALNCCRKHYSKECNESKYQKACFFMENETLLQGLIAVIETVFQEVLEFSYEERFGQSNFEE